MIYLPKTKGLVLKQEESFEIKENSIDEIILDWKIGKEGLLSGFSSSLDNLKREGYSRHVRPKEFFRVIIDYLENDFNAENSSLARTFLSRSGDWLSCAFRKKENILEVALDPIIAEWDQKKESYVLLPGGLGRYFKIESFDIGYKSSEQRFDLREFPNDLIKALYGRNLEELPKEMIEGNTRAQIGLPEEESKWMPVHRGSICFKDSEMYIVPHSIFSNYGLASTIGVKVQRNI